MSLDLVSELFNLFLKCSIDLILWWWHNNPEIKAMLNVILTKIIVGPFEIVPKNFA